MMLCFWGREKMQACFVLLLAPGINGDGMFLIHDL